MDLATLLQKFSTIRYNSLQTKCRIQQHNNNNNLLLSNANVQIANLGKCWIQHLIVDVNFSQRGVFLIKF